MRLNFKPLISVISIINHYTKMKSLPKIAIQASLDELDGLQAEQVLLYIKGLLNKPRKNRDYYELKQEAMKEIRQALDREKSLELLA